MVDATKVPMATPREPLIVRVPTLLARLHVAGILPRTAADDDVEALLAKRDRFRAEAEGR